MEDNWRDRNNDRGRGRGRGRGGGRGDRRGFGQRGGRGQWYGNAERPMAFHDDNDGNYNRRPNYVHRYTRSMCYTLLLAILTFWRLPFDK